MADSSNKPTTEEVVVSPDCPYCGQVGGVNQFDSICEEHDADKATGWVQDGRFIPVNKKP